MTLSKPLKVLSGAVCLVVTGLLGCSLLSSGVSPAVSKQLDVFDCQVAAIRKVIPYAAAAEEVNFAVRSGNFAYATGLMLNLGASMDEIAAVAKEHAACTGDEPAVTATGLEPSASVNL